MKVLILGRSGQVGTALSNNLPADFQTVFLDRAALDLSQTYKIAATIVDIAPDIIINATAFTDVEKAQTSQAEADLINHIVVAELAAVARHIDALLVSYSTDYVFDGEHENLPYTELDEVRPLSVYGHSKLAGERAIRAAACRHLIFRTSWVYSPYRTNFVKKIIAAALAGKELRVVDDQYGVPNSADFVAQITYAALAKADLVSGVYHLSSRGMATWHAFACEILMLAENKGLVFPRGAPEILAVSSTAYESPVERPRYAVLDCGLLEAELAIKFPTWQNLLNKEMPNLLRGL